MIKERVKSGRNISLFCLERSFIALLFPFLNKLTTEDDVRRMCNYGNEHEPPSGRRHMNLFHLVQSDGEISRKEFQFSLTSSGTTLAEEEVIRSFTVAGAD